ncbi:MAG: YdiU family protein [Polyangiaceae bacterium]
MPVTPRYRPAPRHTTLGEGFYDAVRPARFPLETPRFWNDRWSARVGLEGLSAEERAAHFCKFAPLPDNVREPLALRYHGHQFGVYNPMLGDGRGFLFAQLLDPDERLLDLATKGSGTTPWSRDGDGRLTLKGGVREALATEMLEALGVSTSKTFAIFETGERLFRGDEPSPTRSCVLTRLGHSHVRFGSFQRFAYLGEHERLRKLFEYAVSTYAPEVHAQGGDPVVTFLRVVAERSARLAASWIAAGFAHGVLNTDNMNITGESFDYGPYRFVPEYDPDFVAAYFDETGLYAFGKQPRVVVWNLTRLADALRPLSPSAPFGDALRAYEPAFFRALADRVLHRLGLAPVDPDLDAALCEGVLGFLADSRAPLDRFYFDWYGGLASEGRAMASPSRAHYEGPYGAELKKALERHAPIDPARLQHPYFARAEPVTLIIDEIERLWDRIAGADDWSLFEQKIASIRELGDALRGGPFADV